MNEPVSEFVVDSVNEEIVKIETKFDYIIVDTAAGTHCDVISALKVCDSAFAVAEATPLGAHDSDLILQLMKELKVPFEIILNKSGVGDETLIIEIAEKNNKKIYAKIPYNKEIMRSYSKGTPVQDENILKIAEMISR